MFSYERNFRQLEKMFWYYNRLRKALLTSDDDTVTVKYDGNQKETIEHSSDWIRVVDETLSYFGKRNSIVKDVLLRRYINNEGFPRTCLELDISANKYYRARDVGLQFARECAIQLGLLRAF